jgi:hypothetical protein
MVRCAHCYGTYDLLDVEVVARYADCSVFTTPCCGRQADDRKWKSLPDFTELPSAPRRRNDGSIELPDGRVVFGVPL